MEEEKENPILAKAMEEIGITSWMIFGFRPPTELVYGRSTDTVFIRCIMKALIEDKSLRATLKRIIEDIDAGRLSSEPIPTKGTA